MKQSEFFTDYFYFVVQHEKKDGKDVLHYCSGVNITRFLPMLRGRLGLGSNPMISGLQLVKYDLCTLAISKGATPRENLRTSECAGMAPTRETWYTEPLVIENAANLSPDDAIKFCVNSLMKRIVATSLSGHKVPDSVLAPRDLQGHLELLCKAA